MALSRADSLVQKQLNCSVQFCLRNGYVLVQGLDHDNGVGVGGVGVGSVGVGVGVGGGIETDDIDSDKRAQ